MNGTDCWHIFLESGRVFTAEPTASEVRFCAAELKLGFMRAESLKPAEILWRTFTENFFFFSSNPLFYILEY